ncbi:MAG: tetratricopeptide repeat protein [Elusimicrobiaceae bacterium]
MRITFIAVVLFLTAACAFAQEGDSVAQSLILDGIKYAGNKDYDKALNAFDRAISRDPANAVAVYNRGIVYYTVNDLTSAVADFKKACDMGNRGACDVLKQMDELEKQQYVLVSDLVEKAIALQKAGKAGDAIKAIEEALEKTPDLARAYYVKADIYFTLKDNTSKALDALDSAIEYKPLYPEAFYLRGVISREIRRVSRAESDFKKAISLKADYAEPYSGLGDIYRADGKNEAAAENYRKALQYNPSLDGALFGLGLVYESMKDYNGAFRQFSKACDLKNSGACKKAEEIRSQASVSAAKDISSSIDKATKMRFAGKYKDALAYLDGALAEAPESYSIYRLSGDIYFEDLKDAKNAVANYTHAVSIRPESAETFMKRAQAYTALGKYDSAVTDYSEVLVIEPANARALAERAGVKTLQQKYKDALADYSAAIEAAPDNGAYYFGAANVARKMDKPDAAESYFRQSCEHSYKPACSFVSH